MRRRACKHEPDFDKCGSETYWSEGIGVQIPGLWVGYPLDAAGFSLFVLSQRLQVCTSLILSNDEPNSVFGYYWPKIPDPVCLAETSQTVGQFKVRHWEEALSERRGVLPISHACQSCLWASISSVISKLIANV